MLKLKSEDLHDAKAEHFSLLSCRWMGRAGNASYSPGTLGVLGVDCGANFTTPPPACVRACMHVVGEVNKITRAVDREKLANHCLCFQAYPVRQVLIRRRSRSQGSKPSNGPRARR